MRSTDWDTRFQSLILIHEGTPLGPPTHDQLDEFEREEGILFPQSYRDFVTVFGAGILSHGIEIASPDCGEKIADHFDLTIINSDSGYVLTDQELKSYHSEAEQQILRRLYFFGCKNQQELIAWDAGDADDTNGYECPIYEVNVGLTRVASSFGEYMEQRWQRYFGPNAESWDEDELGPVNVFEPAVIQTNQ